MVAETLDKSIEAYLESVSLARSPNTARTYRNALSAFIQTLEKQGIDIDSYPTTKSSENWIADFTADLKIYAPASERLYLTAVSGWYEFLVAERMAEVNLPRLRLMIRRRARRPGQRLPQFPQTEIEKIINYAINLADAHHEDERARLRNLRDRAYLLTLADTGLRVQEICNLRRGDVDWNEGRALLIGKGDRQAVVRFSRRVLSSLKDYLSVRSKWDGTSGRPLHALPLFARHDRGAGKKILPITTTTGRAIVHQRARESIGEEVQGSITPHSFRHYFVTTVLRASGGNLKLAQELARHRNIAVTQRYAHLSDDELDRGYHEIFNTLSE
ncbi:MAG: tyrosine-type recombinase/integrase [Anaerolineales bacterium]|nr:tyrosine-type recombinase/integrase [Anaerolineales bacterium]